MNCSSKRGAILHSNLIVPVFVLLSASLLEEVTLSRQRCSGLSRSEAVYSECNGIVFCFTIPGFESVAKGSQIVLPTDRSFAVVVGRFHHHCSCFLPLQL